MNRDRAPPGPIVFWTGCVYSCMTVLDRQPTLPILPPGQEIAYEVFFADQPAFETEEMVAESSKQAKRKGRLGRLTYEFRTADVLNENRRIYPKAVMKMAIDAINERITRNQVFGNLDHPSVYDPEGRQIQLSDACVKIVECKMTGNDLRVVLDILDNDNGRQLISVLDAGGNPGLSQRAVAQWRDPTDEEHDQYKIPPNEYAVVAEVLRLITYDVVSEPGFPEAANATVTESKLHGDSPMTYAEFKAKHPELFLQISNDIKASMQTEINAEVEKLKPTIVTEALKPVTQQLADEKTKSDGLIASLKPLKELLVKHGLVNEQITDAEAAGRLATAEATIKDLNRQLTELKTASEVLTAKITAHESVQAASEALRAVSAAVKASKHHDLVLTEIAKYNFTDSVKAVAAAQELNNLLNRVAPDATKADETNKAPADTGSVLQSLLLNPAKPQGGGNEALDDTQKGLLALFNNGGLGRGAMSL